MECEKDFVLIVDDISDLSTIPPVLSNSYLTRNIGTFPGKKQENSVACARRFCFFPFFEIYQFFDLRVFLYHTFHLVGPSATQL
jgi:hypothetical protein